MTHLEQAIRDAVEKGGWRADMPMKMSTNKSGEWEGMEGTRQMSIHEVLLDPLFWQALGKARGWKNYYSGEGDTGVGGWRYHWHKLISHLADGHTAESFFANLK